MPDNRPPPNPMMAGLKQAQHLEPDTFLDLGERKDAVMPLGAGLTASLSGLASKLGGMLGVGAKVAPGAIEGLLNAGQDGGSAADMLRPSTQAKMEEMYRAANPTFKGLEAKGMFGGDRTVGGIHQVTPRVPAVETLGEVDPEFTPIGGEGMFNAGRGMEDYMKQWQARLK